MNSKFDLQFRFSFGLSRGPAKPPGRPKSRKDGPGLPKGPKGRSRPPKRSSALDLLKVCTILMTVGTYLCVLKDWLPTFLRLTGYGEVTV